MHREIIWPAFIRYEGDGELTYIADLGEWESDADLSHFEYEEMDRLIDSQGQVFSLTDRGNSPVVPDYVGETFSAEQVAALVKAHFSVAGACCVAKLDHCSIAECMDMLNREQDF